MKLKGLLLGIGVLYQTNISAFMCYLACNDCKEFDERKMGTILKAQENHCIAQNDEGGA